MSKNGAIIILNDIKKERDLIEIKYNKQKNKKISIKEKLIYIFGFVGLFGLACMFFPASLPQVALAFTGYGLGVPLIYSYIEFSKEQKLKRELDKKNKLIKKLEFELDGIQIKKTYIDNEQKFKQNYKLNDTIYVENENIDLESGLKLTLRK